MRRKIRLRYRAAYLRLCLACILSAPIMRAGWWWNIKRRSNFGLNCVHSGRRRVLGCWRMLPRAAFLKQTGRYPAPVLTRASSVIPCRKYTGLAALIWLLKSINSVLGFSPRRTARPGFRFIIRLSARRWASQRKRRNGRPRTLTGEGAHGEQRPLKEEEEERAMTPSMQALEHFSARLHKERARRQYGDRYGQSRSPSRSDGGDPVAIPDTENAEATQGKPMKNALAP